MSCIWLVTAHGGNLTCHPRHPEKRSPSCSHTRPPSVKDAKLIVSYAKCTTKPSLHHQLGTTCVCMLHARHGSASMPEVLKKGRCNKYGRSCKCM
eukprot:6436507-Amphidinium_carterae.2